MIEVLGASVSLGGPVVLTDVSVRTTGTVTGIVGPNGSGKSTLLRAMVGAVPVRAGAVLIDGTPVVALSRKQIAQRIAMVEQSPPSELDLCVFDSVALGRLPWQGMWPKPTPADDELVAEAIAAVGLSRLAARSLGELSGGERQRALLGRALVQGTEHLLLDEPTNHLDIRYQHEILALARERAKTVVVVVHDINLAARYCDEIVILERGRVVASGPPDQVLCPDLVQRVWDVRTERLQTSDCCPHMAFTASLVPSGADAP